MSRYSDMTTWQLREELTAIESELSRRYLAPRAEREPNAAGQRTEESSPRQVPSPAPAALSEATCPLCKPFMIHWEAERRRILQTPCKRKYCPIKIASAQIASAQEPVSVRTGRAISPELTPVPDAPGAPDE
jgi:hypothetical protein